MNKEGMSHIEVILAFVLFISAVTSIFYFFSPVRQEKLSEADVQYLFQKIQDNVSTELIEYGIKINVSTDEIAVNTSHFIGAGISLRAKDMSMDEISSNTSNAPNNNIICLKKDPELPAFIYVFINEDIETSVGYDCPSTLSANESKYQISSMYSREIISENKLLLLNDSYYLDYELLKKQLGVPLNNNFDVNIGFFDKELKLEKNMAQKIEIRALNKKIEVLRKNGNMEFAEIHIRIW